MMPRNRLRGEHFERKRSAAYTLTRERHARPLGDHDLGTGAEIQWARE